MPLRSSLLLLKCTGMDPRGTNYPKTVCFVHNFLMFGSLIMLLIELFKNFHGSDTISRAVIGLACFYQNLWTVIILIMRRNDILATLYRVKTFWEVNTFIQTFNEETLAWIEQPSKVIKVVVMSFQAMGVTGEILWLASPLILHEKVLPNMAYMEGVSPYHEILYVSQFYILALGMMIFGVGGLFFYSVGCAIKELRIIKIRFFMQATEICQNGFNETINHHVNVIGFISDLTKVYAPFVLNLILTSMGLICFGIFNLSQIEGIPSLGDLPANLGMPIICTAHLALFCIAGQFLIDQSMEISDVFLYNNWLKDGMYLNKISKLMVIQMSQKGIRFTVWGPIPLDMNTLKMVLHNAVSIIMFIVTMAQIE